MGAHAYVSRQLDLPTSQEGVGMLFTEVPSRIRSEELESLGTRTLASPSAPARTDDLARVAAALDRLQELVDGALDYVDGVCVSLDAQRSRLP